MSADYHLWLEEQAKGPFTLGQLRTMWNSGQITAENHFTTDAGETWRQLSEILESLEPSTRISTDTSPHFTTTTREKPIVRWWIILAFISTLLLSLFFYFRPRQETHVTSAAHVSAVPTEIKLALNNLKSAIDTGVNEDDYSDLLIKLKSAIATYGDSLSFKQANSLRDIVFNYDTCLRIWKNTDNDGVVLPEDSALIDWFHGLKVNPKENPAEEIAANYESKENLLVFNLKDLLGKVWAVINNQVAAFLADGTN